MSDNQDNLRDQLTKKPKRELQSLAKKLEISRFSSLDKGELIIQLMLHPRISHVLNPSWWQRYHNHVYGAVTILGLLVALIAFWVEYRPNKNTAIRHESFTQNETDGYLSGLLASAQELRSNKEYLEKLQYYIKNETAHLPIGSVSVDRTLEFFEQHYDRVTQSSYGEEKHLFQLVHHLRDIGKMMDSFSVRSDFDRLNKTYNMTTDDAAFLAGFVYWYVAITANEDLSQTQAYSLGRFSTSDVFASKAEENALNMRYFVQDGSPITNYSDFLSFID